ncbi:hypothetical protein CspHIS471_0303760 [Cutaneotrichosporon sp. HIS471]|nr:hypothetical protein CspHIS471_0303760 [Cutaneotrichosporon sp. HIS471]
MSETTNIVSVIENLLALAELPEASEEGDITAAAVSHAEIQDMIPVIDDLVNLLRTGAPIPAVYSVALTNHARVLHGVVDVSCQEHELILFIKKATKPDDILVKETNLCEDWPVEEDDDNWATQDEYWDPEEEAEDGDEVEEQGEEGGEEDGEEGGKENNGDNRLARCPNQGDEGAATDGEWAANTDRDEEEWQGW